jgi:hypothetical protein
MEPSSTVGAVERRRPRGRAQPWISCRGITAQGTHVQSQKTSSQVCALAAVLALFMPLLGCVRGLLSFLRSLQLSVLLCSCTAGIGAGSSGCDEERLSRLRRLGLLDHGRIASVEIEMTEFEAHPRGPQHSPRAGVLHTPEYAGLREGQKEFSVDLV